MTAGLAEILGLFLGILGAGCVVAAASLISTPLAVLTAGVFLLFAAVLTIYSAAKVDAVKTGPVR